MPRKRWFDRFHLRVAKLLTKRLMIGMFAALFLLVYCLRSRVMAQTQDVVLVGGAHSGFAGFHTRYGIRGGRSCVSEWSRNRVHKVL